MLLPHQINLNQARYSSLAWKDAEGIRTETMHIVQGRINIWAEEGAEKSWRSQRQFPGKGGIGSEGAQRVKISLYIEQICSIKLWSSRAIHIVDQQEYMSGLRFESHNTTCSH